MISGRPRGTSGQPKGLCVIRTQGRRMELLHEAICSVQDQVFPITPCIVVHADTAVYDFVKHEIEKWDLPSKNIIVLHADNINLKRGYVCNVGIDVLKTDSTFDFLCFLDDDDHLLPNFAERLVRALQINDADMCYGLTNAIPSTGEPYVQHQLLPASKLLVDNFIPINSYIISVRALLACGARFDETIHYLEDWDFLIKVISSGLNIVPVFQTVSEYRLLGDGNVEQKKNPAENDRCYRLVAQRAQEAAKKISIFKFNDEIMSFQFKRRLPLSEHELAALKRTTQILNSETSPA